MTVLGMATKAEKNPVIRVVHLSDPDPEEPSFETFVHRADPQQLEEQQLADVARAIRTYLTPLDATHIVVRDRDYSRYIKYEHVRRRALFDGVVVAVCRDHCQGSRYLSGKRIGAVTGDKKAAVEKEALSLFGKDFADAGSAALAAWSLRTS